MTSFSPCTARVGQGAVQGQAPSRRRTSRVGSSGLLALLFVTGTVGCQSHLSRPPHAVDKHARHEKAGSTGPEVEHYPEHVAPPPAYGNKVVMATGDAPVTHY